MKLAILVCLCAAACARPPAQPAPYDPDSEPVTAVRHIDAGTPDAAPTLTAITLAKIKEATHPDDEHIIQAITTEQPAPRPVQVMVVGEGGEFVPADQEDEVTYEDGVQVIATKKQPYCAYNGRISTCGLDAASCKLLSARLAHGASCKPAHGAVCLRFTSVVSGEEAVVCSDSMSQCDAASKLAMNNSDYRNVLPCVVVRYKP